MSRWNTNEIVEAVSTVPEVNVMSIQPGEDHTTKYLTLAVAGSQNFVYVRGFSTNKYLSSDDDVEIEMVEVSSGYSDGDMPNDPDYMIVHARVKAAIMRLGHRVVNSMDAYF